jgi:hypothetical protein
MCVCTYIKKYISIISIKLCIIVYESFFVISCHLIFLHTCLLTDLSIYVSIIDQSTNHLSIYSHTYRQTNSILTLHLVDINLIQSLIISGYISEEIYLSSSFNFLHYCPCEGEWILLLKIPILYPCCLFLWNVQPHLHKLH